MKTSFHSRLQYTVFLFLDSTWGSEQRQPEGWVREGQTEGGRAKEKGFATKHKKEKMSCLWTDFWFLLSFWNCEIIGIKQYLSAAIQNWNCFLPLLVTHSYSSIFLYFCPVNVLLSNFNSINVCCMFSPLSFAMNTSMKICRKTSST